MRLPSARTGRRLDLGSPQPMADAFALHTAPAPPPAGAGADRARWDTWAAMDAAHAAASLVGDGVAGVTATGLPIRLAEPMGRMDGGSAGGGDGVKSLFRSDRGRRAFQTLPWWRRFLARVLLALLRLVTRARALGAREAGAEDKPSNPLDRFHYGPRPPGKGDRHVVRLDPTSPPRSR